MTYPDALLQATTSTQFHTITTQAQFQTHRTVRSQTHHGLYTHKLFLAGYLVLRIMFQ